MKYQLKDIYQKITRSYLHKVATHPAILPCVEIVGIMVQQGNVSNHYLTDARDQPLANFQLEDLH